MLLAKLLNMATSTHIVTLITINININTHIITDMDMGILMMTKEF